MTAETGSHWHRPGCQTHCLTGHEDQCTRTLAVAMASLDPDQIKMLEVQHVLSNSIETLWRCATAVDEPSAERQSQMQTDLCVKSLRPLVSLSSSFDLPFFNHVARHSGLN